MIEMVGQLLEQGHAYVAHGTVYFDVVDLPALRRAVALLAATRWCALARERGGNPTIRTGATRSTSCCGSRRCPTSRRGRPRSASAARAGTWSAR